jgi:hypothetical protein
LTLFLMFADSVDMMASEIIVDVADIVDIDD